MEGVGGEEGVLEEWWVEGVAWWCVTDLSMALIASSYPEYPRR